ncbi:MAG TPA: glycerol-3-phosphate 1-O-acyltransferase PlsY [Gemmatirosa sp.]|nr:glycerol-3-phosphate 1-O-acyltransferase PlsY [Gemmatirosa sp.]
MHPAFGLVAAYLLGSVPAAYLAGRAKAVDLRRHGSGNLGATNAWRVLGWKVGLAVYAFDTFKGALPVALLPGLLGMGAGEHTLWRIGFGLAAIAGHVKPVFLAGKGGGKGVATAGGVFAALAPLPLLAAFAVFGLVFLATGYVSLGSLSAAAALPIALLALNGGQVTPVLVIALLVSAFVFWTHRANIGRLRAGTESRFDVWRRGARRRGTGDGAAGAPEGRS